MRTNMIPSIIALSQYLLEDLHDYQECFKSICLDHSQPRGRLCNSGEMARGDLLPRVPSLDSLDSPLSSSGRRLNSEFIGNRFEARGDKVLLDSLRAVTHNSLTGAGDGLTEPFSEGSITASGALLYPGAHPATVACNSLLRSIRKKYRDLTSEGADERAATKFLRSNLLCKDWVLNPQNSGEEELFGCLRKEIDDFLHPSGELLVQSIDSIFESGRLGPGASLGANGVDFYSKLFSSKLTATSFEVYYQYAERCATYPVWGRAEFNRLSTYGLPAIVTSSRVTFVPKDLTQTRSICTEPSLNMFFQLGLGQILTDRLKSHFGIDLSRQPERNVRLARLGSEDGSVATIDLESASDSMSLALCYEIFPAWFLDLLEMYRTPSTELLGDRVDLHMVSTMGNGFTFPLQTLVFACVVRAVASSMRVDLKRASGRGSRWGVFGDDIICPTEMSDRVITLLRLIGFRVNSEKSYTERYGRFRESCGGDFYMGHNVRGVYIKTLRSPQSRYVAINLLNEWSAKWRIPLPRAVGYLQDSVRHLAVPPWAPVDSGIRIPHDLTLNRYGLWASVKNGTFLYRYYQAWVPAIRVLEGRLTFPRGVYRPRRRMYNPDGLLMAFVGGHIQNSEIPISLKQGERPRYRMRLGRAAFWAPTVEQEHLHAPGFWGWWKTIVPFNLRLTES